MLRPERMSRVSVTGTKRVMRDVIEAVHDLNLVHLVDYDDSWEGFSSGDPLEPADEDSERLVTVRAIESILDIEDAQRGSPADLTDEEIAAELEEVRAEVNELDDRRNDLEDRMREIDERIDAAEPFLDIGIDLDLLSGYDALEVRVGEGDVEAVRAALDAAEGVGAYEVFSGEEALAAVARADPEALDDALVGAEFTSVEVPDAEGDPEGYVADLRQERREIESELETVRSRIEDLRVRRADFLLSTEERLSIEVQKAEAPLRFATTENAFVAEGWIPTERYDDLVAALSEAVGDRVEVEELERADYDRHGHAAHAEETEEVAADGGTEVAMSDAGPPVVQDNPTLTRPFELLVRTISRPRYSELDPTVLVFLTFPTFFGFMIGDLGYGIFYALIGYLMFTRFDSPGLKSLGGVGIWAGFFTMVFGVLYGEIFGLHVLGEVLWGTEEHAGLLLNLGHPPMEKGISATEFALLWLFTAMVLGLLHVGTGYVLDFVNTLQHSVKDAVLESASWFMLMFGVWVWILSRHLEAAKPAFLFDITYHGGAVFTGFPAAVGPPALAVAAVGFVLMAIDEYRHLGAAALIVAPLESLNVLVNILSYARITAVLLAKAGMAFVVNLLVFGMSHGHFVLGLSGHADQGIGLVHGGVAGIVGGLLILVVGHGVVWALGITSAGLQSIRLEYVEFFQKFYEGGGDAYEPFGYERA